MDPAGDIQRFHTANVLKRIKRYMPFVSGMTYKVTVAQTDINRPYIITDTPYAKYLYHGKVLVDPKTGAAGFRTPNGWRSRKGCVKVLTQRYLISFSLILLQKILYLQWFSAPRCFCIHLLYTFFTPFYAFFTLKRWGSFLQTRIRPLAWNRL